MVDRYWRKIEDVENNIENAMQISSILLKLKAYDNKLSDLGKITTNEGNISSNLGKITANEGNISSNLGKINTNEGNISSNLGKITTNEGNISSNLGKITTNVGDISSNLEQINDIKSLLPKSEIFKKTYSITNQSFKFFGNIIFFKLLEIEIENTFNVDGKLEIDKINYIYYKYNNLQLDHHRLQHEYRIFDDKNNLVDKKIFNKTNNSIDLNFDNNIMLVKDNFYVTFKDNYNKIKIILYLYRVNRKGIGSFNLELINENFVNIAYLDKNDISLKINTNSNDISSNLGKITTNEGNISSNLGKITTNEGDISSNSGKITTNVGDISSNFGKITTNEGNISSNLGKITTNEGNISSNLGKITTNEGNISSNLMKINSNEDDVLYNLSEINYIKNNNSTQYLKNIYNILFYDKKTQINFRNVFYEKVFDVNANKNDFVEMKFKIDLQYEDISERNYVKTLFEIFDENNNRLYVKSTNNNKYLYFSNRVIVDENIFYNFTKDVKKIKFAIKFQMILSRVIKIFYIKNDNYRLVIKNYGL